jgi:hypothetical protein
MIVKKESGHINNKKMRRCMFLCCLSIAFECNNKNKRKKKGKKGKWKKAKRKRLKEHHSSNWVKKEKREGERAKKNQCRFSNLLMSKYAFSRSHPPPFPCCCLEDRGQDTGRWWRERGAESCEENLWRFLHVYY